MSEDEPDLDLEIEKVVEEKPRNLKELVPQEIQRLKPSYKRRYEEIVSRIQGLYEEHPHLKDVLELFLAHFQRVETMYCYDRQFQQGMYWIVLSPRTLPQLDHVLGYAYQTNDLEIKGLKYPTYVVLYFDSNYVTPEEMERVNKVLRESSLVFEAITDTVGMMVISLKEAWHRIEVEETYSHRLVTLLSLFKKRLEGIQDLGTVKKEEEMVEEKKTSKWRTHILPIVLAIAFVVAVVLGVLF